MSREAFEKIIKQFLYKDTKGRWASIYREDTDYSDYVEDAYKIYKATIQASKPKWIPVTESRDGANPDCPNDGYWICVEHKETKQRE